MCIWSKGLAVLSSTFGKTDHFSEHATYTHLQGVVVHPERDNGNKARRTCILHTLVMNLFLRYLATGPIIPSNMSVLVVNYGMIFQHILRVLGWGGWYASSVLEKLSVETHIYNCAKILHEWHPQVSAS